MDKETKAEAGSGIKSQSYLKVEPGVNLTFLIQIQCTFHYAAEK